MNPESTIEHLRQRDMLEEIDAIRRKYGVTLLELCSRGRKQHVIMARREVWWTLNRRHGWSYQTIADAWGWEWSTVRDAVWFHDKQLPIAAE